LTVRGAGNGFGREAGALWLADIDGGVLEWADGWCASDAGLEAFKERSRASCSRATASPDDVAVLVLRILG
jgi:hypothetical protein